MSSGTPDPGWVPPRLPDDAPARRLLESWLADRTAPAVLVDADLRGADLSGGYFGESWFTGSDMRGIRLVRADLYRSDLTRARLDQADLTSAGLVKVVLDEAGLRGAVLTRTLVDEECEEWLRHRGADVRLLPRRVLVAE